MTFVFASNNQHKLEEVRSILPTEIEIKSLREIGFLYEIDETGDTLECNSSIKAQAVWNWIVAQTEMHNALVAGIDGVFADDTGLEIAALGGLPGVRTARWADESANDAANRTKCLKELEQITDRRARFRTVITLIRNGEERQVEGIVEGRIAEAETGDGGFGYDPVFIPEGYNETFACLPAETKNAISHRKRALEAMRTTLLS